MKKCPIQILIPRERINEPGYRYYRHLESFKFVASYRIMCPTCGEIWASIIAKYQTYFQPLIMGCPTCPPKEHGKGTLSGGHLPFEGLSPLLQQRETKLKESNNANIITKHNTK